MGKPKVPNTISDQQMDALRRRKARWTPRNSRDEANRKYLAREQQRKARWS